MSPWQELEVESGAQPNPILAYLNATINDHIWLTTNAAQMLKLNRTQGNRHKRALPGNTYNTDPSEAAHGSQSMAA